MKVANQKLVASLIRHLQYTIFVLSSTCAWKWYILRASINEKSQNMKQLTIACIAKYHLPQAFQNTCLSKFFSLLYDFTYVYSFEECSYLCIFFFRIWVEFWKENAIHTLKHIQLIYFLCVQNHSFSYFLIVREPPLFTHFFSWL